MRDLEQIEHCQDAVAKADAVLVAIAELQDNEVIGEARLDLLRLIAQELLEQASAIMSPSVTGEAPTSWQPPINQPGPRPSRTSFQRKVAKVRTAIESGELIDPTVRKVKELVGGSSDTAQKVRRELVRLDVCEKGDKGQLIVRGASA